MLLDLLLNNLQYIKKQLFTKVFWRIWKKYPFFQGYFSNLKIWCKLFCFVLIKTIIEDLFFRLSLPLYRIIGMWVNMENLLCWLDDVH